MELVVAAFVEFKGLLRIQSIEADQALDRLLAHEAVELVVDPLQGLAHLLIYLSF